MKYKIAYLSSTSVNNGNIDINLSYSLEDARSIVKELRMNNQQAELYPEEYAAPQINEKQAREIATREYQNAENLHPGNYGSLNFRDSTPIYYTFYCRDYQKEAAGMTPGYYTIMIDKLDGHILSKEEFREYRKLNYSF